MPYRIDVAAAFDGAVERLIELGALDVECAPDGALAALMPDSVSEAELMRVLGGAGIAIAPAIGRDADSVWLLTPRPIQVGGVRILPAHMEAEPGAIRLVDAPAFGTGRHPTTQLCIEALRDIVTFSHPDAVLDVGTGSGVLALAALTLGVPRALGTDIDAEALRTAAENARLNGLAARLALARGGPESVAGAWPLVLANVLAAPLIEMAPSLVRRVGHHGRVVLSGIPSSVEGEVEQACRRLGMHRLESRTRGGWVALVMQATW